MKKTLFLLMILGIGRLTSCVNDSSENIIRKENGRFPNYLQSSSERWDDRDWEAEDEGDSIGGDGF